MVEIDSKRKDSFCQQAEYLSTAGDEKRAAIIYRQPGNCHMIITPGQFWVLQIQTGD